MPKTKKHMSKKPQPRSRAPNLRHRKLTRRRKGRFPAYPIIVLAFVLVGILLVAQTMQVLAATINVHGENQSGPAPTIPAAILTPTDGEHVSAIPIPITGTCESGAGFYVKLFRNNIFSGSASCSTTGTFSITSDLFEGENKLSIHTANGADVEGPPSVTTISVFYDPPVPPTPVTTTTTTTTTTPETPAATTTETTSPFYISPDYYFQAASSGDEISETFTFVGGKKPYRISVNWGDGFASSADSIKTDTVTLKHTYKPAANTRMYYTVAVNAADSAGNKSSLQLFSIMNDGTITGHLKKPPTETTVAYHNPLLRNMTIAWPVYIGSMLLVGSYTWGARKGLENGLRKARSRSRRPRQRAA